MRAVACADEYSLCLFETRRPETTTTIINLFARFQAGRLRIFFLLLPNIPHVIKTSRSLAALAQARKVTLLYPSPLPSRHPARLMLSLSLTSFSNLPLRTDFLDLLSSLSIAIVPGRP